MPVKYPRRKKIEAVLYTMAGLSRYEAAAEAKVSPAAIRAWLRDADLLREAQENLKKIA